jgi:hypothetical protein
MTIRRISPKRRKLNAAVKPWRDALKESVGRCDHCRKLKAPEYLDCDEISRGCTRGISLTAAYAILVVCRPCHSIVQPWSRAKRLALLYLARGENYDLSAFHQLTARCFPDQCEVDAEIENLLAARTR